MGQVNYYGVFFLILNGIYQVFVFCIGSEIYCYCLKCLLYIVLLYNLVDKGMQKYYGINKIILYNNYFIMCLFLLMIELII